MDSAARRRLARLISQLDQLGPDAPLPLPDGGRRLGAAFRIGVTGPLGAGKSTLINQLARSYRARGLTVGVVAVDPTSPFTGGALLGDRVRMTELTPDDGVFIRSMATRGSSGGITDTAEDAADLLDAFGFDRIILETVGVGQSEVEVAGACDLTCVVVEPGSGDGIQAMKAGLMEIADLFVVNKKDRKGADRFILELATVLELRPDHSRPDILATAADRGEGVAELCDWMEGYLRRVSADGTLEVRRSGQRVKRIRRLVSEAVVRRVWEVVTEEQLQAAAASDLPVRQAARELVDAALGGVNA